MKKTNWYKWTLYALIIATAFFLGRCGGGKTGPAKVRSEIDTVYAPGKEIVKRDTVYVPQPYAVTEKLPYVMYKSDTVEVPVIVEVEKTPEFGGIETAFYRDSLPVDHGYALITDTISDNRITGRRFSLRQSLPIIKEVTSIPAKQRAVLYAGLSAAGSKQNYLYAVEGSLALKARNEKIYALGVGVTEDNQVLFRAGFMFPVRLRK